MALTRRFAWRTLAVAMPEGRRTEYIPGLGRLEAVARCPADATFWRGTFVHRDGGYDQMSHFHLCSFGSTELSPALIELASHIMSDIDRHIAVARRHLGTWLQRSPGLAGIIASEALHVLETLPFDTPEPTFYEDGSWQIRFVEGRLSPWPQHGIAVTFAGESPTHVEVLVAGNGGE